MTETPQRIPAALARRIRLVALDVDGVLTDGGIFLGATASGERVEMKRFEITDGLGIQLLQNAGVEVAIVTGRESAAVRLRAEELRIRECHQGTTAGKLAVLAGIVDRLGLEWSEVAFVGDDLADLPVLRRVGLPATVANAVPEIRAVARWVARRRGGEGAVRELAEALLQARGDWSALAVEYVGEGER